MFIFELFCVSKKAPGVLLSPLLGTVMSRLEDKTIEDIAEWLEQQGFDESVIESFRGKCYFYEPATLCWLVYIQVYMLLVVYLPYCLVLVV